MNMISLCTLHKEYLPAVYHSYIQPLWSGIGIQEQYYTSSALLPYITYIQRYREDTKAYSLYQENPLSDRLHIKEDYQESTALLQESIATGIPITHKETTQPQHYKTIALAYLLEEQEYTIQQEYKEIATLYSTLQAYIPQVDSIEPYVQKTSTTSIYAMMEAILYYCREDSTTLFIIHTEEIESLLTPYIVYSPLPHHLANCCENHPLLQYYKGYIPEHTAIFGKQSTEQTPRTILILDSHILS